MGRKRRRIGFGQFLLLIGVLVAGVCGVAGWSVYRFIESEFPDVSVLKTHYPVVKYEGEGKPFTVSLRKSMPPGWTTLGGVSRYAVGAIIVSEDWAFYSHKGYDANQIKEAIKADIEEGRFARGASTITQQVVKNVFLTREKSLWRKVKELVLSVRLEEAVGKRKILESYLNIAEWGEGIFGIRAAARFYFDKSPLELTAKEGAFLAMLLPSPKRYSQSFRQKELTHYARRTISQILSKMTQARYLTVEERDTELSIPLSFEEGAEIPMLPVDVDAIVEPESDMDPASAFGENSLSEQGAPSVSNPDASNSDQTPSESEPVDQAPEIPDGEIQ